MPAGLCVGLPDRRSEVEWVLAAMSGNRFTAVLTGPRAAAPTRVKLAATAPSWLADVVMSWVVV